ncbi:MAG: hypothetical protein ACR2MQ_05820 [Gemmatimonadaceae bacterium]
MSIPVISPIEITISHDLGARLLPAGAAGEEQEPDYTVQELSPQALPAPEAVPVPAVAALNEIEHATAVSEYHDFEWWRTRISTIRSALEEQR